MSSVKPAPIICLLHGDDEFAIDEYVEIEINALGDVSMAAMNISRLDGRNFNYDELLSIAAAVPFLTSRRLVILAYPSARLVTKEQQDAFTERLKAVPASTRLLLVEYKLLTEDRDRKKGRVYWLEKWALSAPDRVEVKIFMLPKVEAMGSWIQKRAKEMHGQVTPQAAKVLASLVGADPRRADRELEKLLDYVDYKRAVESEDVALLTADTAEGNIFELVDAIGSRDGRQSMALLERLLEQDDEDRIFAMVIRQFRLLLQAREVLDGGGRDSAVASALAIHPYVAEKIARQAQNFSLAGLERIYHHLLELDTAIKSSQMTIALALETLVAGLTLPKHSSQH